MAFGPGSIAFVGYNADGTDNLAFVALETIAAGTVITFTDNEWSGSAFNTGESTWTWTATGDIAAGTIVTLDGLAAGQTATSNLGSIAFTNETQRDIGNANETVYAYVAADTPVFLAAISDDNFTSANGLLTNTGLVQGTTALSLTSLDADADIAAYAGVRGADSFAALLPMINNPANWISQDTAASDENDGAPPDLPFTTSPFAGVPNFQTIGFTDSLTITETEGDSGEVTYTFTVERSGGTVGAIEFSGTIGGTTNGADFGGTKPLTFSGVIADGATSATVTVKVSGDTFLEPNETVVLSLTAVDNDSATTVLGSSTVRTAIITDDDPYVVVDGQVYTGALTVPGAEALTVEEGGTIQGDVTLNNPGILPSLTNSGTITSTGQAILAGTSTSLDFTGGIKIVNNAGGLIEGATRAIRVTADLHGSTFTLVNAGTIKSSTQETIRLDDAINGNFLVENLAGGLIQGGSPQNDVMRVGNNTTIVNAGTIENVPDIPNAGRGGDGIDFKSGTGSSLHNLAGGHIEASRHGVTGEKGVTVVNDAGGVIAGRNGSAVNIDNDATVENTVYVTNYGLMQGKSGNYEDSDGDAIDTDGLADIDNYGTIEGLGHNGYHDGEPNVSEGIAIGGGVINNYAGGEIYGYGRAIEIDDSSNGNAFAATTVYNEGLIQGDGNAPTDVTPEEIALFEARIKGGEAINFLGDFADSVTNTATGEIVGGIRMGGGDDVLTNAGTITATGGSAVDMGDGDDEVTLEAGGVVTGTILLGQGADMFTAAGAAAIVDGGDGDDSLSGGAGNDQFAGGAGSDTLIGGGGIDSAIYAEALIADSFVFNAALGRWEVDAGGAFDNLTGIERVEHGAGRFLLVGAGGYASLAAAQAVLEAGDVILLASEVSNVTDGDAAANRVVEQAANGSTVGINIEAVDTGDGAGPVSFSLVDSAGGRFAINAATGVVTVAKGSLLDFEAAASHLITVRVTNQWGDFSDQTLVINVVDVTPAVVDGGKGRDKVVGTVEADSIDGGKGNDVIDGGEGDDTLAGGKGADKITGGEGIDTVSYESSKGGVQVDLNKTGAQKGGDAKGDTITGVENLTGSDFNDVLTGNDGANVLDGGKGNDKLDGRGGIDTLIGGKGSDLFVFKAGFGADTIADYKAGADAIDLSGTGIGRFKSLKALMDEADDGVLIDFGDGETLTIANATIELLSQNKGDFDLA